MVLASVSFRSRLRTSSGSHGGAAERDPDETSGLLAPNGGHGPRLGSGTGAAYYDFFLSRAHTPGCDSGNVAVWCAASAWHVAKLTLLSSYVNFLLLMVPVGILAGVRGWSPAVVFGLNFLAIIPLAAVIAFATEEISSRLGDTLGGLVNATFGNAVELIVSIVALRDGQIEVVQASMLGSILSNLLLVMGMCFLVGGIVNMNDTAGRGREQIFASATAQTTCSLLTLASASLVIPAALYSLFDSVVDSDPAVAARSILILSRGTAIVLLALYALFLFFQLRTHSNLFAAAASLDDEMGLRPSLTDDDDSTEDGHRVAATEPGPCISPVAALAVLVVTTMLVSICADYLVGSIDALVVTSGLSKAFIGLVLIPIVGNAAEHVTAILVALRDKMDLAIGVAVGSGVQIALLVTPFLVIVGWIMGQPMTLLFDPFETTVFVISVLVVTYTVQDGKSNYLEGAMLMGLYLIIALAFYATPSSIIDKVSNLASLKA